MNTRKFDEIIKNKVNEANFEFNPAHWEKASQLLDAEHKLINNSTKFKTYTGISIALFCVVSVFTFYYFSLNSVQTKPTTSKNYTKNNTLLTLNSTNSKIQQSKNSYENEILKENKLNNIQTKPTENNTLSNNVNNDKLENNTENLKTINNTKQTLENNSTLTKSPSVSIQKLNANTNETTNLINSATFAENILSNTNDSTQQNSTEFIENNTTSFLPNISPNLSSFSNLNINIDDNLLRTDYSAIKKDDEYYRDKKQKKQFLNCEANLLYNYGWNHLNQRKANAFNFNFGVNYGLYMLHNFSLSFGAHCYSVRNVNQTIFSDTLSDFKFGVKSNTSEIINNHLMYLTIPINVNYHINNKNYLSAGISIGTKVYSKNTLITSNYIGEELQSTNSESNNFNYYNVADRNILLEASYSTIVTKKLWLKAGVYYSVNDLFKQVNGIQNLKGINIGIKYEIFNK